ncbi:Amino acid transporters [Phaffia rhodozyma]|uniref:Amino acid transporters n=1 Tax=Phaffia rhodozyma TaxID=264483 RepID=A0A0F7SNG1_PHARH|nr:Amino acid transporters [Phaffia rhodozyma]
MSWSEALRAYALVKNPSVDIPKNVYISSTERFIVIKDGYPKSTFHYLILPRIPFSAHVSTSEVTLGAEELNSLRSTLQLDKEIVLDLLDGMEDVVRDLEASIQTDMRRTKGHEWDILAGFHAVPSMKHLHLHVFSKDLCSDMLKNKKHYWSFHPEGGFFLNLETVRGWVEGKQDKEVMALPASKYEPILKQPLRSFWTGEEFKTIPKLKAHLENLQQLEFEPSDPPGRALHRRSNSTLNAFSFDPGFLPLSLSASTEESNLERGTNQRHLGFFSGVALVVGLQVGSGIFSSPGVIVHRVDSAGASLVVWVVAGLLAWTGASSFAEIGSAIPVNGGAQAYLAYAYGPMMSYLYSWTALSLLKPGSAAIIALIFGEYICRLLFHVSVVNTSSSTTKATSQEDVPDIPEWAVKAAAIGALALVTIVNISNAKAGSNVQIVLTAIKICTLLFVLLLGFLVLLSPSSESHLTVSTFFMGTSTNMGDWAIAIYSSLWGYDGWDQLNFVAGEMVDPARDLPRVIHSSMALVIGLFTAANVSYLVTLSKEVVASSNTVALDFGLATLGPAGATVFSVLVAISTIGALNGSSFTSARLVQEAAREKFLPGFFGSSHPTRNTPVNALLFQSGLTALFVLFGGGFRTLVNLFSVAQWLFYFLTVLGLIILRYTEPHLERPYRTYITTPLLFCTVALFLLLMPIVAAPKEAIGAFCFISLGFPIYLLTQPSTNHPGVSRTDALVERLRGFWRPKHRGVQPVRSIREEREEQTGMLELSGGPR